MMEDKRKFGPEDYDKLYNFYESELAYNIDPLHKAEALHLMAILFVAYKKKNPKIEELEFCMKVLDNEGTIEAFRRWFIVPFSIELKYMLAMKTKLNSFGFTNAKDIKARIDHLIIDWLPF